MEPIEWFVVGSSIGIVAFTDRLSLEPAAILKPVLLKAMLYFAAALLIGVTLVKPSLPVLVIVNAAVEVEFLFISPNEIVVGEALRLNVALAIYDRHNNAKKKINSFFILILTTCYYSKVVNIPI